MILNTYFFEHVSIGGGIATSAFYPQLEGPLTAKTIKTTKWILSTQSPVEIYDGGIDNGADSTNSTAPIRIRVGTGGAGQSGILKALADAYIQSAVRNGSAPFRIAWYQSDTFVTIQYLRQGVIDVGITYNEVAEKIAIDQGVTTDPSHYLWRDHFYLVGPITNPANLSINSSTSEQFLQLYTAAEASVGTSNPVRFLTRFDKSATNVKECQQWITISQTPWSTPYSTWYHQYISFPVQALETAIALGEYTLTDRGTFLTLPPELTGQLTIFKAATDDLDHPLLNPAHGLISTRAKDINAATDFCRWIVSDSGGQQVIRQFSRNGQVLYSVAPTAAEIAKYIAMRSMRLPTY